MKHTDNRECPVCGNELNSPLARARGHHESCVEKNDTGEYIEK